MAQESWKREQEAGCQPPDGPIRCAKNCGFFGSSATSNMCSKCYRDHVIQQTKEAAKANAAGVKAAQMAASVSRPELMDVDMDKGNKEREASDTDFMSGVHVLAGMAAKDKAAEPSMQVDLSFSPASSSHASPAVKQAAIAVSLPLATAASATAAASPGTSGSGGAAVAAGPATHPNRCAACKKKVGLTGFKCRCNGVFCSSHRYSDKHDCTFDYKAAARESIAKANPVVRGSKIEKI